MMLQSMLDAFIESTTAHTKQSTYRETLMVKLHSSFIATIAMETEEIQHYK